MNSYKCRLSKLFLSFKCKWIGTGLILFTTMPYICLLIHNKYYMKRQWLFHVKFGRTIKTFWHSYTCNYCKQSIRHQDINWQIDSIVDTWLTYLTKLDGHTSHELWDRQHNVSYVIQPGHRHIGILKIKLTWWCHVWRWCFHGTLQVVAKFLYFSVWWYPSWPDRQLNLQTAVCTIKLFQAVIVPIFIAGNFATDWA